MASYDISHLEAALQNVPIRFRSKLLKHYLGIHNAFLEQKHDYCGQHAGKFCETYLRFLQYQLTKAYTPFGKKIGNFKQECEKLEQIPSASEPESLRIVIPRALVFLYTMRNKRDVGHVGGDVAANAIDAATYKRVADWCICELIRVVHSLSLEDAQALLDLISIRQIPQIWCVDGKYRVLDHSMNYNSKTMLLLYSVPHRNVSSKDLYLWAKHKNFSNYKRDTLQPLDQDGYIEYDQGTGLVWLSPSGAKLVEEKLLRSL
jgi:hypothetical protein